VGLTLAAATGYFRVAADRHYLSDVLVGGGLGSLIGFVNPFFVHRQWRVRPRVAAVTSGAVFALGGHF
jgi:membrane-associated phospholipid phosphatase